MGEQVGRWDGELVVGCGSVGWVRISFRVRVWVRVWMVRCGEMRCGVAWCNVVWCGGEWCGVVWGVVWYCGE